LKPDEALRVLEDVLSRTGDERAITALRALEGAVALTHPTFAQVAHALLHGDETYRLVFSHERDPSSIFESETGRIVEVNEAWCSLYGYTREEALTMRVMDVSAEPDSTRRAIASATIEGGMRVLLRWHKKKDGTVFPVELTAGTLEVEGRALMYSAMRDISERVRAEEALARSEASFRALIESMVDSVVVHRDGRLVYMNPAARAALGYAPAEDVVGVPVLDLFHPDDRELGAERTQQKIATGSRLPLVEERFLSREGKVLVMEVSAMPTVFDGELATIAIGRDVSARRQMESQLMMSDRLASIGRLAASVGHELNNPLAYVLGTVSLMKRDIATADAELSPRMADRLSERLDIVREGAERMRGIVRDLKTLARADDEDRGPVDVSRVVDVCAEMAAHEIRQRAQLVKDVPPDLHVLGSEARLGQVFLNLLVNAAQAIPEGADGEVYVMAARVDRSIVVEVRDTGVGIRREDAPHVFEPFFTTKPPGAGTGLGLPICHHIVTSLGGTIETFPNEPRGTCFRVTLPAADGPHMTSRPASPRPAVDGARVLIVDDEAPLAAVCAAELDGYETAVVHGGRQAIERIDAGETFDAIVCDLLMPDRTGVDVFEHLRAHHPGAERRIVFMTGGAPTRGAKELLERAPNPCLEKPFTGEALRAAVRQIILTTRRGG
jgi:PAS domain S-box-containing protein